MTALFFKSLIIGFAIAAPLGPIGVLCIQRSLRNGFKIGLLTGMGAALANGVYGIIAGFGFTAVSSFLIAQQFWIRVIGGLFLVYLGIKLLVIPYQESSTISPTSPSIWKNCSTAFLLALTNPVTIISFLAVFAGLGVNNSHYDFLEAIFLTVGVTVGSACWWLLLTSGIIFIPRQWLTPNVMRGINIVSGIIIGGFGIFALRM